MNPLSFISDIFKPAADLIDNVHTSDEEKLTLRNSFQALKNVVQLKVIELEKAVLEAQSKILNVEMSEKAIWIQKAWRPITMLTFLTMWVLDKFSLLPNPFTESDLMMLKIGLSGYIAGRSAEKVAEKIRK